jgi:TonB-linked SusC/RagA family outer membrane protein
MRQFLCWLTAFMLSAGAMYAQTTISGTVTDNETDEPIEGVAVLVKGTTIGMFTNASGDYSLTVPAGETTLLFTYIGKRTVEEDISGRKTISVSLVNSLSLEEVVVTAIGIERDRKALGYGIETISGEKIAQKSEPDALRAIQGKIAGVNITGSASAPGSATRITIRGNSSLSGENQPLFVVDGIPYNNGDGLPFAANSQLSGGGANGSRFNDIDPNNIKSITVLKGAAASALYGVRAANGAIVITTKTGSAKLNQPLRVTLNSTVTFEGINSLPDYQNTYGTGVSFAYAQANGSWGHPFSGTRSYANIDSINHWYLAEAANFSALEGVNRRVPYQGYPNNVEDFFETGIMYENSIQLSAGSQNASVSAVISYLDQGSFIPEAGYNKLNMSLGGQARTDNQRFSLDWNMQYTRSQQDGYTGGANNAVGNSSLFSRTMFLGRNWDLQGQPFQDPINNASLFFVARTQASNPYWSALYEGIKINVDRFAASTKFGFKLTDWLDVSYRFGLNTYNQGYLEFYNPGSRAANQEGRIINGNSSFAELDGTLLLSADYDFSSDLNVRFILGNNINQRSDEAQFFQGDQYVVFDINDIDNTNNVVPFGGGFSQQRIFGNFFDGTLSYRDWLFFNISGRLETASTLPVETRTFGYGSASLAWVFSDAFSLSNGFFDYGKVRFSAGQTGNAPGPYVTQAVFNLNPAFEATSSPFGDFPHLGIPGATLSNRAADPDLQSERSVEAEVGLDLSFFKGRIDFSTSLYRRLTTRQLANVTLASSTGFTSIFTNVGQISNTGIELTLGVEPIRTKAFQWNILGTFTHNRNVIEDLGEQDEVVLLPTFGGSVSSVHIVGEEYGLLRGTVAARDDEGNLLIDPTNGELIAALDQEVIGNPNPDFIVGITNTFTFKGLSLNLVFDWRQGGDLYSVTNLSLLGRGVTMDTEDREIGKIIPGVYGDPNTGEPIRDGEGQKIPNSTMVEVNGLYFGETFAINAADEWSVYDATVIRLREVSLGYDVPKSLMNKISFIRGLRLSVTGRNLWFNAPNFPPASNFDPETNTFGNGNAQGFEFTTAPSLRRVGINLGLTF